MKQGFLLALIFTTGVQLATAQAPTGQKFVVTGDVTKLGSDSLSWVFLSYAANGEHKTDSAQPKDGKYIFNGLAEEPVMARLIAYRQDSTGKKKPVNMRRDVATLFLQPGKITVTHIDSFANVTVAGSPAHKAYLALEEKLKPVNEQAKQLNTDYGLAYQKKDEETMNKLKAKYEELQAEENKIYEQYIKANPSSPIAVYVISQYAGWDIDVKKVEPIFNSLSAAIRKQPAAKSLEEKIALAKKTGIGNFAMDFTQNDTLGNPVKLSSFKGRYVLIDFWASWCGPCRAENPNVVKAFNKYKDKGFHVLGVSLDQPTGKEKWIKAIHDDQLTWTHVSDLQFWKNAVAVQYGIQSIPQNLLLDKEGRIIAKNIRGEALDKKLAEVFTN